MRLHKYDTVYRWNNLLCYVDQMKYDSKTIPSFSLPHITISFPLQKQWRFIAEIFGTNLYEQKVYVRTPWIHNSSSNSKKFC